MTHVEDWVHAPGSGVPAAHLPEHNQSTLEVSHDLVNALGLLLSGHPVRVTLSSNFSEVSAVVSSTCRGFAQPADLEALARAAMVILAHGGYGVGFFARDWLSDAALLIVPAPGKAPRTDVSIETCIRALSRV